ncbi:MAG: DNA mismatch repair protein MutS [Sphingomonadales bacterium]
MSEPLNAKAPVDSIDDATPMMAQYLSIKADHPEDLLFYRMGDFYELFFEDAVQAAAALDIALTKRGQHQGRDIPMCGVPVHAAEAYLARLIRKNFRVAICEQMEDPAAARARGAKAVVARAVVRLVTPGTLIEDSLLDPRAANYLVALGHAGGAWALAWADMSTGEFAVADTAPTRLEADLARLAPREILLAEAAAEALAVPLAALDAAAVIRPGAEADSGRAGKHVAAFFGVGSVDGLGDYSRAQLIAAGHILAYLGETQKGRVPRLEPPRRQAADAVLLIDRATLRNLEILTALSGSRDGGLLATIDRTVTGAGARLLASRLAAPLTDPGAINQRLDAVDYCLADAGLRGDLRAALRRTPDLERALSRLALGRGGPRDVAAIGRALAQTGLIRARLEQAATAALDVPAAIADASQGLGDHGVLADRLARALVAEPPVHARDGGFIAAGHDPALDELKALRDEGRRHLMALEGRYRDETGIAGLKIKHNNVLGYHIDVAARHADKLMAAPFNQQFTHRQTLANAVRFSTQDLADLAGRISRAADQALAREQELFEDLVAAVLAQADAIAAAARALAALDVHAALAELAASERHVRPRVDASHAFAIAGGRHPAVEAARRRDNAPFIANDCDLGPDRRLWLLTGPNMAGKSTFLRQNALIAVMAQAGAFVPATAAHIGVVDRLFSRVGASDDLAQGRSTFMVEMIETAAILNQATARSLVILDEIGRGTATFDGLSIAWAALEHLHDANRCRGLFATHYHELTALAGRLDALSLHAMKVREWRGDLVFLHEVAAGTADRSYGIQVARLAGLPDSVVKRASAVLARLEADGKAALHPPGHRGDDLPLFAPLPPPPLAATPDPLQQALKALKPDDLSPRQALEALYRLKGLADGGD